MNAAEDEQSDIIESSSSSKEVVYSSSKSMILRTSLTESVEAACKTLVGDAPSSVEVSRLNNEWNVLTRQLKSCPSVRHALPNPNNDTNARNNRIYLEWLDGQTLREWMDNNFLLEERQAQEEALLKMLRLAKEIALAVNNIHEAGVVHSDLSADNIIILNTGKVKLIDFGFASPTHNNEMDDDGNLVNDDLYSLGVLFHEMIARLYPTRDCTRDCTRDSNDNSTRDSNDNPFSSFALPKQLPTSVSKMIIDLLEMDTNAQPYQTAKQLHQDLQSFTDSPDIFLFNADPTEIKFNSQKLYGRQRELDALLDAYHRSVPSTITAPQDQEQPTNTTTTTTTTNQENNNNNDQRIHKERGTVELVLVEGYSGTGKSTLVHKIQQQLLRQDTHNSNNKTPSKQQIHGYFLSCKFDQLRKTQPYSAFVTAFSDLVDQILSRDEETQHKMREDIERAVGMSGTAILMDLIPKLRLILTPPPPEQEQELQSSSLTSSPKMQSASNHSFTSSHHGAGRRKFSTASENNNLQESSSQHTNSTKKTNNNTSNSNNTSNHIKRGAQTSVEAQNRFTYIFRSFVRVISQPSHPVCLFLDDLQWADAASLDLLKSLAFDKVNSSFLLIGCYRDNEIQKTNENNVVHPLLTTIHDMEKRDVSITKISIGNLDQENVNCLISDALALSRRFTTTLTNLVCQKTGGNVFFVKQFLTSLKDEGLLYYCEQNNRWMWNEEGINSKNISNNVVDLMAGKILKLPVETQNVLKIAACVGSHFDLEMLSLLLVGRRCSGGSGCWFSHGLEDGFFLDHKALLKNLGRAISEGMLTKVSSAAAAPPPPGSLSSSVTTTTSTSTAASNDDSYKSNDCTFSGQSSTRYKFSHDRIQQAAYSLLPGDSCGKIHLRIGNTILKTKVQGRNTHEIASNSYLFMGVDQLNRGSSLITKSSQRLQLARWNLKAGERATASSAFQTASTYFKAGINLLEDCSWETHYELSLGLFTGLVETEFCNGNHHETECLVSEILLHAKSIHDKFRAYNTLIKSLGAQGKIHEAIHTGLNCLKELGEPFPSRVDRNIIVADLMKTKWMLRGKSDRTLANLPVMQDRNKIAAIRIMSSIFSYCYIGKPEYVPLVAFRMMRLSLKYGLCEESAFGLTLYGVIIVSMFGDFRGGCRFGKLALALLERFDSKEWYAHVGNMVHHFLTHWTEHAAVTIEPLMRCYRVGRESGDNEYAMYSAMNYCIHSYLCGRPLAIVEKDMDAFGQQMKECGQDTTFYFLLPFHQSVMNLMGKTEGGDPMVLTGDAMNQDEMLRNSNESQNFVCASKINFMRLILAYLFGDYKQAREILVLTSNFTKVMTSMFHVNTYTLYKGLTAYALARVTREKRWRNLGRQVLKKMKKWARYAPGNCLHKALLLEAEDAALRGKVNKTIKLYDDAISNANKNGYIQEEALAYERAALFFRDLKNQEKAAWYFARSHQLYLDWGANSKADHLRLNHPIVFRAKNRDSFHLFMRGRSSVSPTVGVSQMETSVSSLRVFRSE